MNLRAVLLLTASLTRVEGLHLTTVNSQLAVRVALSGEPGVVAVHRETAGVRVSVVDVRLGGALAGGSRFSWTPAGGFDPALLAAPARLDGIEVVGTASEVSVLLQVPPEVSIDVRRDSRGLLLILREAPPAREASQVARAEPEESPPEPPDSPDRPAPDPVEPAPPPVEELAAPAGTGPPAAASAETLELARSLFRTSAAASTAPGPEGRGSVDELYAQLFPSGTPRVEPETVESEVEPLGPAEGVPFGPFTVRAAVDVRYIDADTFIEGLDSRAQDRYVEVAPGIAAEAPVGDGRLGLEYRPTLRAFASFDEVGASSHHVTAEIDAPLGPSVVLSVGDSFVSGVLDTRVADPGGEYFFDLGRFHRNTLDGGLSVILGPRTSLELAAATSSLRFQEDSSFFDHDTRLASAGLAHELTPTLVTTLSYVYDTVPRPTDRPEAESRAHNARLTLTGDIRPLLTGQVHVGYRSQESPNAGEGGTRYSGLVMGGSLTRQFTRESDVTLFLNRSTPVSAFEDNAYYVFTAVQGAGRFPLPLGLQLRGGVGYQWNDYRTVSDEIGAARRDRILSYYVGLRRSLVGRLFLSAYYRGESRDSNIDAFDTDPDGFILQLEWDIFGNPRWP